MAQTPETKKAIERDKGLCMWCLYRVKPRRVRDCHAFVFGYHPMLGGGHHILGRARVDTAETILTLCCECHYKVENAKISNCDMIQLACELRKVDLFTKYREFHKCQHLMEVDKDAKLEE